MRRRPLLAAAGTALTVLTAGCSDVTSDEQQQDYELNIYNGSRDSHTIAVRITNSVRGHFQQERFDMGAETGNEDVPVGDSIPYHSQSRFF